MKLIGFHDKKHNIGRKDIFHQVILNKQNVENINRIYYSDYYVENEDNKEFIIPWKERFNRYSYNPLNTIYTHLVKNAVYEAEITITRQHQKGIARIDITNTNEKLFNMMETASTSLIEIATDLCLGEHEIIGNTIRGTRKIFDYNGKSFKIYNGLIIPLNLDN